MEISKLRATEKMLEETKNKLACLEEELKYAKEKIKTLKSAAEKECKQELRSFSYYLLQEARITTEVQEVLADEIKTRLSTGACTREIAQLVEPFTKLRIKG